MSQYDTGTLLTRYNPGVSSKLFDCLASFLMGSFAPTGVLGHRDPSSNLGSSLACRGRTPLFDQADLQTGGVILMGGAVVEGVDVGGI